MDRTRWRSVIGAPLYSPHAWGWTGFTFFSDGRYLVFPTRVGMDHSWNKPNRLSQSIPHTRGDGPGKYLSEASARAYSPHAWGWTESSKTIGGSDKVFPTRVGMDQVGVRREKNSLLYSPHAWGWTLYITSMMTKLDVFPTRVGMDRGSKR